MACHLPIGGCAMRRERRGFFSGRFCSFCSGAVLFGSGRVKVVELAQVVELPRVWSESVQSRDPASGTERLPFPPPRTRKRRKTRPFPKTPSELSGGRHVQARGTSPVDHAGGTRSCGRQGLDDAHREVATSFSFGVLCKCLWVAPVLLK